MKNIFKKIGLVVGISGAFLLGILIFSSPVVLAQTANFWTQNALNSLATNTSGGLANGDIHVAHCYIGLGTGTPCSGGGGGTVTSIAPADSTLTFSPNPITATGTIGLNLSNSNTWIPSTGTLFNQNGIATTATTSIFARNSTASTLAVPVQISPALEFMGHMWQGNNSTDHTGSFRIYQVPTNGANAGGTTAGTLQFASSKDGAYAANIFSINQTGNLNNAGSITAAQGITSTSGMIMATSSQVIAGTDLFSGTNGSSAGHLFLLGGTSGTLGISAPSVVTNYTSVWPAAQGTGALTNDGAGNLSWSSSFAGTIATNQVAFGTGTNIIGGSNDFLYNDSGTGVLLNIKGLGNPYLTLDPFGTSALYSIGDIGGSMNGSFFQVNDSTKSASLNVPLFIKNPGLAAVPNPGLSLDNTTSSTSPVPAQYPPLINFLGTTWNGTSSILTGFRISPTSTNTGSVLKPSLNFDATYDGSAYTTLMAINGASSSPSSNISFLGGTSVISSTSLVAPSIVSNGPISSIDNLSIAPVAGNSGRLLLTAGTGGGIFTLTVPNAGVTTYSNIWPATQGALGTTIINNGSGTLSWNKVASVGVTTDLPNQSAAISATTLFTPSVTGMYRITVSLQVTTAASVSSILGGSSGVVLTYNDGDSNVAQTMTIPFSSVGAGGIVVNNSGNTTTSNLNANVDIYARTGVAIQYAIGYTSVGGTAMVYAAHLRSESI